MAFGEARASQPESSFCAVTEKYASLGGHCFCRNNFPQPFCSYHIERTAPVRPSEFAAIRHSIFITHVGAHFDYASIVTRVVSEGDPHIGSSFLALIKKGCMNFRILIPVFDLRTSRFNVLIRLG